MPIKALMGRIGKRESFVVRAIVSLQQNKQINTNKTQLNLTSGLIVSAKELKAFFVKLKKVQVY